MNETANEHTRSNAGREGTDSLFDFLEKRITPHHRRGRKAQPVERRKISRNAHRLIKRILTQTTDDNPLWCESNEDVAKALKVDRSTVVRNVKRLLLVGVLQPVETTGGRGRPSQYLVNREKAQALLRLGYWGAGREIEEHKAVQKEAQQEMQAHKPAQEILPETCPSTRENTSGQYAPFLFQTTSGAPLPIDPGEWAPLERLGGTVGRVFESVKRFLRDPVNLRLIGHVALFSATCMVGAWGVCKIWTTKGKGPALVISIPAAVSAYYGWKLVDLDLELFGLEHSSKQSR